MNRDLPRLTRREALKLSAAGQELMLCDFASAGAAGNAYVSWLPAPGVVRLPFTRENPSRTRSAG